MSATAPNSDITATAGRLRHGSDAERRRHLIDVAEAIFLENGYHAATMADIARRAGMSKKTIYVVFPSKEALFDALLSERLAPLAEPIVDDGRPAAEILVEFLTQVASIVLSPKHIALTRLMVAESSRSPEIVRALRRQAICNGDGALEVWLGEQAAQGRFAIDDIEEAAAILFGMSIGELMIDQLVKSSRPTGLAAIRRRVERSVHMFLAGLGQPAEPPALRHGAAACSLEASPTR